MNSQIFAETEAMNLVESLDLESDDDFVHNLKIVMLGSSGSGKTTLVNRFTQGNGQGKKNSSNNCNFSTVHFTINNEIVKLKIWDASSAAI